MKNINQDKSVKELVSTLFLNDHGTPFILTPTQEIIVESILKRQAPDGSRRLHIKTYTQFGKSECVAIGVLLLVSTYPEKVVVVAPSQAKSRILIGKIIKHAFENEYTLQRLSITEGESVERLRRERSKNRLTFNVGDNKIGEVFILSAEGSRRNAEDIGNAMMGFGCIPEGFLIRTDQGDIPIDRVVKEKLPVKILSYNHDLQKDEWKDIVSYQINPILHRKIIEITVSDKIFQCTDDHPVYVESKGYIEAKNVKKGDIIFSL